MTLSCTCGGTVEGRHEPSCDLLTGRNSAADERAAEAHPLPTLDVHEHTPTGEPFGYPFLPDREFRRCSSCACAVRV